MDHVGCGRRPPCDIDPVKYYDSSIAKPSFELLCIAGTYDPKNGTVSNGDIYRVKQ